MLRSNDQNWDRPGPPAPQADPAANFDPNQVSLDLLQVALRRKGLLILGILIGLGLAFLYYVRTDPTYESTAQLLIDEKSAPLPGDEVERAYEKTQTAEDHSYVMTSPYIIGLAMDITVDDTNVADLPSLSTSENPLEDIHDGLQIQPLQDGSSVLYLSFRGPSPDDCAVVLNGVMEAYRDFLNASQRNIGADMMVWMKQARNELSDQMTLKEDEYNAWKADKGHLFIQDGENGGAINMHQQRQAEIERERRVILLRNSELQAKIEAVESAIQQGVDYRSLRFAAGASDLRMDKLEEFHKADDQEVKQKQELLDTRLFPLLLEDAVLAQKFGSDHPRRRAIQRQIEEAHTLHEEALQELAAAGEDDLDPDLDEIIADESQILQTYLESLRQELRTGEKQVEHLTSLFNDEQRQAETIAKDVAKDASFANELDRMNSLYDAVVARLEEVNLLEAYEGDRYLIQSLQDPHLGLKVAPSLARTMLAGTALGLMAGFGLGYLLERTDTTFKSPQEIGQLMRAPLVGHVPDIPIEDIKTDGPLAPSLIAAHRPKSTLAESFRGIRTALYFNTSGQGHRVIQSTSPVPGDGKSTLTANLAITIAQSSKRVLLLDADFRRPTQHKLFSLRDDVGVASVVEGLVDPSEAVQETAIPNLYVMACGPRPSNPSELLTSPRFEELINVLREQYDFVLIDTPPLLAVTDPSIVAARVDGVLVTMRIRKNGRPAAARAKTMLDQIGANVVGVIVNGVGLMKRDYGYYSNYQSGYGYGYGYRYNYSYSEKSSDLDYNKYYEDHKDDSAKARPKLIKR